MTAARTDNARPGPIRVAIITTSYPLTAADSSGAFVAQMARHLPATVAPWIVTPCADTDPTATLPGDPPVHCFRYAPRRWRTIAHRPGGLPLALRRPAHWPLLFGLFLPALGIACLRATRRADLLHANWSVTGVLAGLAARLSGKPAVTTIRGTDLALAERSAMFRSALRLCARLNQRLVTVGDALHERATGLLGRGGLAMVVIPNGIDDAFFALADAAPVGTPTLIGVGSLLATKGWELLLAACARLAPAARLTLIGDGPARPLLEQSIHRLGLTGCVTLTGALPPADIPGRLASHQIFVLPSWSEGRPNALLEAMAAGRAVVASAIPGVTELITHGDNGLLFPPGDVDTLARLLAELLAEPARITALGARARASVLHLRWAATGAAYADLYRQVLAEARR